MHAAESDPIGRRAGQYARATVLRLRMRTLVALGILAVCTALLGRINGLHAPLFLASEMALLASMFAISRYILPVVERRDRGAMAEEQVGALLDDLPQQKWRVVHDVTLGRGNVDHIVIGPPGVFTIETKSHPGPIRASRVHGAMLSQAQAQGRAIAWVTGVEAESLIVFSRAWVDRPGARRKGVRILPARMLVGFLQKRPTTLTQEDIERTHRSLATAVRQQRQRGKTPGERWALIR
jgi:Nuclease-related domain